MSKLIISLVGYGGSGKTTIAKHLHNKYGFYTFTFSNVIRDYAKKYAVQLNKRADFAKVHSRIIDDFGVEFLPSLALKTDDDLVCIDNLSSLVYADYLRKRGGQEIAFVCPTEVRFSRTHSSGDSAKYPSTIEAFIQNEQEDEKVIIGHGVRIETPKVIKTADYHVDTDYPLVDVIREVDNIIDLVLKNKSAL